jgi:hypothetical protein
MARDTTNDANDANDDNDGDDGSLLHRRAYLGLAGAAVAATAGVTTSGRTRAETRVNIAAAGADTTGVEPVNDVLTDVLDDGVEVYFPPGTYRLDPVSLSGSNWSLVGEDATLLVPAYTDREWLSLDGENWTVEGFTVDLSAEGVAPSNYLRGSGWTVRDLEFAGRLDSPDETGDATLLYPAVATGSTAVFENVRAMDGSAPPDGESTRGLAWFGANSRGTMVWRDCAFSGWANGTIRGEASPGELVVEDCLFENTTGGVRCGGNTVVRDTTFDQRGSIPARRATGAADGRGVWINASGHTPGPVVVEGCSFLMDGPDARPAVESGAPVDAVTVARTRVAQAEGSAIALHGGGSTSVLDVSVTGASPAPAISFAGRSDSRIERLCVHQPGVGVRVADSTGVRLTDSTVDVSGTTLDFVDSQVETETVSREGVCPAPSVGQTTVTEQVDLMGAVSGDIDVVADFGADNTGSTDTTAEVQNAVGAASPGDVVVFPNGSYRIDGISIDTDGVTLRGESRDGVVLLPTGNGSLFSVGQNSDGYGTRNWLVDRFTVDVTEPSGGQIYSYDNHEVSFDAYGTGEYRDVAVNGSMMIDRSYWDMFRCKNVPRGEVVTLTRLYIPHGVADTESDMSSSGKIVGAFSNWNVDGGVRLDGCHIERGGENTIYVEGANRVEIVNSYVSRANVGIRIPGGPADNPSLIDGLVMDQRYEVARQHWNGDSNARGLWNDTGSNGSFVLRNSHFDLRGPEGGVPVDIDGSNDWTIENCRFAEGSWAALYLQSGRADVSNCDFASSTGVVATAAGGSVFDCRAPSGSGAFSGFDDVSSVSSSDIREPKTSPPVDLSSPYSAPGTGSSDSDSGDSGSSTDTAPTAWIEASTVVEEFADGDIAEYTGATDAFSVVQESLGKFGTKLVQSTSSTFSSLVYAGEALAERPTQGDTFSYLFSAPTAYGGGVMFGVADPTAATPDRYGVYFDPRDELQLYKVSNGALEKIARSDLSTAGLSRAETYEIVVSWNDPDAAGEDAIAVRARDQAGSGVVVAETVATAERELGDLGYSGVGWGDGPGQEYTGLAVADRSTDSTTDSTVVVDDFADGDIAEYTGATGSFSVVDGGLGDYGSKLVQSGSSSFGDYILAGEGDLAVRPTQGDTFSYLFSAPTAYGGGVMFGVADPTAATPDRYGIYFDPERELQIYKLSGGTLDRLAITDLSSQGLARAETYEVAVSWNDPDVTSGAIVARVRDGAGTGSVVAETVAANEQEYGDLGYSGIGWGDGPGQEYAGLRLGTGGRPAAGETLPEHTLAIEATGETANYEFTVSGDLVAAPDGAALEETDTISGSSATGVVDGSGADTYRFSGSVTDFSFTSGSATIRLNGTERTATDVVGRPLPEHTLVVRGTGEAAHYEFAVSDAVEPDPDVGGIEEWESITGATASGWVEADDVDAYRFSGTLSGFGFLVGSATVEVDGAVVDPTSLDPVDVPALPHRLVIGVPDGGGETGYAFEVGEAIAKSPEAGGTRESTDLVDGTTVEGSVASTTDTYRFAGDLLRLDLTGTATVDLDRDAQ